MKTPIFSTQREGHPQHVQLFNDKLTLHDTRRPLQPEDLPLRQIKRIEYIPHEPQADVRRIDLAIETTSGMKKIVRQLDLAEARQLEDAVKRQRVAAAEPAPAKDEPSDVAITRTDRILKQLNAKATGSSYQAARNKFQKPNLSFYRRVALFLILPVTLFGQIEITTRPAPELALLMNLPSVYLLPSSPLYPLKEWWEEFRLIINTAPEERTQVLTDLARGHLAEVVALVQKGDFEKAAQSLAKYQDLVLELEKYQPLLQDERVVWLTSQLDQHQEYRQLLDEFLQREGVQL